MSAALHSPTTVFSLRHAPSWMLLAFAAGSVNAAAFLACQRFVSHVTGNATSVGLGAEVVLDYAVILLAFIAGAMASVLALDARQHRGKRPLHGLPLLVVAAILVAVALAGSWGAFGAFGSMVQPPLLLLSSLAFAMGLQNATVATTTALAVRTTHMTGPATDLGVNLGTAIFATGDARRAAQQGAALRAGKITSFIAGAGATVPLAADLGYLVFVVPAALVVTAKYLSFRARHAVPRTAAPAAVG